MYSAALSLHHRSASAAAHVATALGETVETQLWVEEHEWLYALLKSPVNVSPTFRLPDLISACVTLVLAEDSGGQQVFDYLKRNLVLRNPRTQRRREHIWREQYEQLRGLQMSVANRHPNPMFQLDQLTTACVALVRGNDAAGERVLDQARRNTAARAARLLQLRSSG